MLRTPTPKSVSQDPLEIFARSLNDLLAPHESKEYQDLPETFPTMLVVGNPRSGTTLAYQLASLHLNVGYISNLAATFWKAPLYGIRLQRKLLTQSVESNFCSTHGLTHRIEEPSEFAYFWARVLGVHQMQLDPSSDIDWQHIARVLINFTHEFRRPVVHKPFFLYPHLAELVKHLPRVCYLFVFRDLVQTALSILDMRVKVHGSKDAWFSVRPADYACWIEKPYWEQIAHQVHHIYTNIQSGLAACPQQNSLIVTYPEICQNPKAVLQRIVERVSTVDCPVEIVGDVPDSFEMQVRPENDEAARLREALLDRFNGQLPDGQFEKSL